MQFLKNTDKTKILNSFYFNFYLRTFLFHKVKNPPLGAGFSIFKEKSTRPIFHNSAGGTNNA